MKYSEDIIKNSEDGSLKELSRIAIDDLVTYIEKQPIDKPAVIGRKKVINLTGFKLAKLVSKRLAQ